MCYLYYSKNGFRVATEYRIRVVPSNLRRMFLFISPSYQSSVSHIYSWCLANAVLYLTNCLPGRAGGLGTNKTCVNSPFQFVSPESSEPPETKNIVRLGPGSHRSQSHSHYFVLFVPRNWMKRMKNYTLSLDVLKFGNFSKADSEVWGWIF